MSKRTVVHLLRPHLAVGGTPTLAVSSAALPPSIRLHTVRPAKTPLRDHVMPLSYSARMYSSRQINCASEANRFLDHPHLLGASIRRTGTRVEIEQRRLRTALTRIETFAAYAFSSDKSPAQAEPWPPKKSAAGLLCPCDARIHGLLLSGCIVSLRCGGFRWFRVGLLVHVPSRAVRAEYLKDPPITPYVTTRSVLRLPVVYTYNLLAKRGPPHARIS